MLSKPFLAKCADRKAMPKMHPVSGSPEDWYSNELLYEAGLLGISFDFFVNWTKDPVALTPVIWIKRILSAGASYLHASQNALALLLTEFGEAYLKRLLRFAGKNHLAVQFVIFKDDCDWQDETSAVLLLEASIDDHSAIHIHPQLVTINDFKKLIQQYSGGNIKIGSKGLIYGTSCLECFLSNTDSLYPGDADLVLLDSDNVPVAIVEFKKHTLAGAIDGQRLSNYYPHQDRRKYDRLAVLRDYLSNGNAAIPMIVVYYPTGKDFKAGLMEIVSGNTGNLSSLAVSKFPLPVNGSKEQSLAIIQKTLKAIAYYKTTLENNL